MLAYTAASDGHATYSAAVQPHRHGRLLPNGRSHFTSLLVCSTVVVQKVYSEMVRSDTNKALGRGKEPEVRVTVRVPLLLYRELKTRAAAEQRSLNGQLLYLLGNALAAEAMWNEEPVVSDSRLEALGALRLMERTEQESHRTGHAAATSRRLRASACRSANPNDAS